MQTKPKVKIDRKVLRGGSYFEETFLFCRSVRGAYLSRFSSTNFGFRIVMKGN